MGSDELIPNMTFFIQLGLFFATFAVLQKFVFTPYLALLDARRERTSGLKEKALRDREQAQKIHHDYEEFMKAERKKVTAWLDEQRKEVSEEERHVLQTARTKAGNESKALTDNLNAQMDRARKDLSPLVNEYASVIASKLIGRKVSLSGANLDSKKRSTAESTVTG